MKLSIDILMITYNRPEYTILALSRLLETCDDNMRVWVWHNGNDERTLEVVKSFSEHPSLYKIHHSKENKKLTEPTNWLWSESGADYLTKVDDDCLMPFGWADTLRQAHHDNQQFGVIGCWRFPDEDFIPEYANAKIQTFNNGHQIMRNCWVEGSGYLMKKECVEKLGLLKEGQSFPNYCIQIAKKGYINGWYYPFLYQDHFDDPRSKHSQIRSDEDIEKWAPLSAKKNGVKTVAEWESQLKRSSELLQKAPYETKHYGGWRSAWGSLLSKCSLRRRKKPLW